MQQIWKIGAYAIYNTTAPKTDKGNKPGNANGIRGITIVRTGAAVNIKAVPKCNGRLIYMRIQNEKGASKIALVNSYSPQMERKADIRRNY